MKSSWIAAAVAVTRTRENSEAQQAAGSALVGTTAHRNVPSHLKAASREWNRARSLQAHRVAFQGEHEAREFAQVAAAKKQGSSSRRPAELAAWRAKKQAGQRAQDYYKERDAYGKAVRRFGGAGSSDGESGGEMPLRDYPREGGGE